MRELGTYSLVATLIFALGAAWLLALGAWSERKELIRYGYYAVYGFFLTTVIASAVLLQAFLKGDFSFALEDVALVALGRERVAVSCIILVTPHGEQPLGGSAFARQGENESIVRATLDAVNRRMNFLTTP